MLELEVRCDPRLNSGVQVRSHVYGEDDPTPRTAEGGRRLRPAVRGRPQGDRHGGPVLRRGRRGRGSAEIKPEAKDAFRGRRLEPLPDRRPGPPLPLLGQRRRRQRLHRRRGRAGLHRPPGPRHPEGRGAVSGPLAEHPHPGVEAGRGVPPRHPPPTLRLRDTPDRRGEPRNVSRADRDPSPSRRRSLPKDAGIDRPDRAPASFPSPSASGATAQASFTTLWSIENCRPRGDL